MGEIVEPPQGASAYAVIHYAREDGDYGDHTTGDYNDYWGLHLWGDIDETIEWTAPKPFLGEDDNGRFAWIKLAPNAQEIGFIVHRGDAKDGTDSDRFFNPGATPEIWLKQDDATSTPRKPKHKVSSPSATIVMMATTATQHRPITTIIGGFTFGATPSIQAKVQPGTLPNHPPALTILALTGLSFCKTPTSPSTSSSIVVTTKTPTLI